MSNKSRNKRDNCFYCERKFTLKNFGEGNAIIKTVDHIIPESKGGADKYINAVVCCRLCNGIKSNFTLAEFIKLVENKIKLGETWGNLPKESLNTIVRKATELQQYVEDKGVGLYKQKAERPTI